MKKALAILLALAMILALAACGEKKEAEPQPQTPEKETFKVGMVCIGNPDYAYDRNFIQGADEATARLAAKGIDVEWIYKYDHPVDDDTVTADNEELVEEGCKIIFNNSYGQEPYMLKAAKDHPEVTFVGCTNEGSWKDDLDNTSNAFASIYEGRYLAGVAAGLKLNELIENGTITEDQAVLGYVGAFTFAEVISGYTAFFLGARSVCPSATMNVQFVGSWSDATEEANAAAALIDQYHAVVVSQHSDNTTPASKAQEKGVFHVGYNVDMSGVAPQASIISSRIDWANYFEYAIETVYNGGTVDPDWCKGLAEGSVALTELNEAIAAPGTAEKIAEVAEGIKNGSVKVFDTDTFTVEGQKVESAFALDMDGDFTPETQEAIQDGAFLESTYQSAPYFALRIDGINLVNVAF